MFRQSRCIAFTVLALGLAACRDAAPPAATASGGDSAQAAPAAAANAPAASPAPAAEPTPDALIRDVFAKFKALRSYQANMRIEGSPRGTINNDMQFVAPDRYRLTMRTQGMEVTQVQIGGDVYVTVGGRTMKTKLPQQADPARWHEAFDAATLSVEAQGNETLDGVDTRKYLVKQSQEANDAIVWIDGDNNVRQARVDMEVEGRDTTTTIVYSRFDDPSIRIEPPN